MPDTFLSAAYLIYVTPFKVANVIIHISDKIGLERLSNLFKITQPISTVGIQNQDLWLLKNHTPKQYTVVSGKQRIRE